MGWILILIQVIGAIPSIIATIRAIIGLINGLDSKEKKVATGRLKAIMQKIRDKKEITSQEAQELKDLMCDLESGSCKK